MKKVTITVLTPLLRTGGGNHPHSLRSPWCAESGCVFLKGTLFGGVSVMLRG